MNATVKPGKLIKGQTGGWEVVIGMEIHAQVTSRVPVSNSAPRWKRSSGCSPIR